MDFFGTIIYLVYIYILFVKRVEIMRKEQSLSENNVKKSKRKKRFYPFFKRVMDLLVSFVAIIVLSPIFLIIYLLSLIILRGNPILVQYRPGKNNKIFPLYKFRSMTNKTDEKGNLLPDKDRITKWGKFLRKTSIDELPQLFNILAGHMSFVGPRPRLVKDFIFYEKEVLSVYTVRPGVTGPAQVYDRNSVLSWEEVFARDEEYIENLSFFNDIKLFIKTFIALFKGGSVSGAENNPNKRAYYYPDQLLKDGKISKEQYETGLEMAKSMKSKQKVTYMPELASGYEIQKEIDSNDK